MADILLLVDDDAQTLRLVSEMLTRQGYQVIPGNSGAQALELAHSQHPDVVLLDVNLPDMDGLEVTRRLRAAPDTADLPIILLTGRDQVDDKIAGYDAGVDDYVTKPAHPAELNAHIKALINRTRKTRPTGALQKPGRLIGFVAAKGGIGLSTLVLNCAVALQPLLSQDVTAVELRPSGGTWGPDLGIAPLPGFAPLFTGDPGELTSQRIERELVPLQPGVRLLLASTGWEELETIPAPHYEALLEQLPRLAGACLVDLGVSAFPQTTRLLDRMDEVVVGLEPTSAGVVRTRALIDYLSNLGFGRARPLTLVLINRIRADMMLTWTQVQEQVGRPVTQVISPAPELAYQASLRRRPMIAVQPDSITAQQVRQLAELLSQHTRGQ